MSKSALTGPQSHEIRVMIVNFPTVSCAVNQNPRCCVSLVTLAAVLKENGRVQMDKTAPSSAVTSCLLWMIPLVRPAPAPKN